MYPLAVVMCPSYTSQPHAVLHDYTALYARYSSQIGQKREKCQGVRGAKRVVQSN